MPRDKKQPKSKSAASEPPLVATAQQSRFHADATDPSEVASKDVNYTLTFYLIATDN
jgi:hypothetical protein